MNRYLSCAALAALALVGCPIPQPLPGYPAGTVTPPRILAATASMPDQALIPVPANCPGDQVFDLGATIFYQDSVAVEARWFVDYKKDNAGRYAIQNLNNLTEVPPDPNKNVLTRQVPGFPFHPYGYAVPAELGGSTDPKAPGVVHVVELVVSNGFDTSPDVLEPNRTPAPTFEIQTYRWTFVNVAGLTCPP